jgi:hypothetical protein
MARIAILFALLAGCVETAPAPTSVAPGTTATYTPPEPDRPDACDMLAPEANLCCSFDLGCSSDPIPTACTPPQGTCWERACPLSDGTVAQPGTCA